MKNYFTKHYAKMNDIDPNSEESILFSVSTVGVATVVPEPTSMLLICSGLICLVGAKRNKFKK